MQASAPWGRGQDAGSIDHVQTSQSSSAYADLVRQAQAGDDASIDSLAEPVRDRVYPYVRRVVLD